MNFIYCRRVYIAYKKEKSKRKVSKLLLVTTCKPLYLHGAPRLFRALQHFTLFVASILCYWPIL